MVSSVSQFCSISVLSSEGPTRFPLNHNLEKQPDIDIDRQIYKHTSTHAYTHTHICVWIKHFRIYMCRISIYILMYYWHIIILCNIYYNARNPEFGIIRKILPISRWSFTILLNHRKLRCYLCNCEQITSTLRASFSSPAKWCGSTDL